MQRLLYVLAYPLLWLISILPYTVFYIFSDVACFIVFRVVGYRKKVVKTNLELAFPEKSQKEISDITQKFYRHFCDIFLEMTKTITISKTELKSRFVLKNPEEMKRLEGMDKSYVIMLGHYNSYEWVTALQLQGMHYKAYGIYKKLRNRFFDQLIRKSRGKFETIMLSKNDVAKKMIENKRNGVLASYGMIADQSPKLKNANHWLNFFGQDVPAFIGSEKMAKHLDFSVTYLKIEKVKRGYYEAEFVPLADNPKNVDNYKITEGYFKLLEQQIREKPEYYLWSHKRWKHAKK